MIIPVVLAGGSGSRLWPVSRESYPKQFCAFGSSLTLFQQTAQRAVKASGARDLIVVGNYQHRFIMAEQLRMIGIEHATIILEPFGRDSAGAILAACFFAQRLHEDAVLWIMPSDAYIGDPLALESDLRRAVDTSVRHDAIALLGIKPTQPYSEYGYIQQGAALDAQEHAYKIASFIEKPSVERAQKMLAQGGYFWNAGMFVGCHALILRQAQTYMPRAYATCSKAVEASSSEMGFVLLDREAFSHVPALSFDYGLIEKTPHICLVHASFAWSDLGTWEALWHVLPKDQQENVTQGNVVLRDVEGSLVDSDKKLTVLNHVDNLIVVTTPDAVLVSDRAHVQEVKQLVALLRKQGHREGIEHARMYRPWGFYETLIVGHRFKVKYIHVKPGGKLSLQKHYHRAEHWVVVAGTAKVTSQDTQKLLLENESAFLPAGTDHRLENPGKIDLVVIEIQSGAYLGEDDIVRLQDAYARGR